MALSITTTIINAHSEVEWYGVEDTLVDRLKQAEDEGETVRVLREGSDGYYDVQFEDGTLFPVLSWYHLEGFTANGPSCSAIATPPLVSIGAM